MRILFWCDSFWPEIGGLEVFCLELSTALAKRGHSCAVITDDRTGTIGGSAPRHGEVNIHRFQFAGRLRERRLPEMLATRRDLARVVEELNPDVIHVNTHHSSVYFLIHQQKIRRRPSILTLHDRYLFQSRGPLSDAVLRDATAITAISGLMRDEILAFDPTLAPKLQLIPNALPVPEIEPAPLPWPPRLLAFGRVVHEKGFDLAIEAFVRVAAACPEVTLTLAGDGDELDSLKSLAQKTGFASRIHFTGWIEPHEIPALLNRHSIVLMPSRWREPFGLVAVQAAQMGRPIVAAASGAIPEIVVDGVTGCLFENENVADFAAKLRALVDDRARAGTLGKQARSHALAKFSFDRFVTAYEDCYAAAVAARRHLG